jgi:hypothetical protein
MNISAHSDRVAHPAGSRHHRRPRIEPLEDRIALAYTATVVGSTATFNGNSANDAIIFSASGGLLTHSRFAAGDAGFNSEFDFNSGVAGDQTLAAAATSAVITNSGGGNDAVNIGTASVPASSLLAAFTISNTGADGDSLIVDDSARTTSNVINVTSAGYSGTGINIALQGAGFSGGRTLRTGTGGDTVNVRSVASSAVLGIETNFLFTGGGNDEINIGSLANSLDGFEGQTVSIDAGTGLDTVNVNDQGDASAINYQVADFNISRFSAPAVAILGNSTIEQRVLSGSQGGGKYTLFNNVGNLTINAGAGTDILDAREIIPGASVLTLNGGGGIDTILGSNAADTLNGGPGNDVILGSEGSDLFTWNPGDGSDVIDGGSGSDQLIFIGAAASEFFELTAQGTRLELTRNIGAIDMDVADVEEVSLFALGGSDQVRVNNLGATTVRLLHVDLGLGDGAQDIVTLMGTALPDTAHVSAPGGNAVLVEGLSVPIDVSGVATSDRLIIEGEGGIDALSATPAAKALIEIVLNGEPGANFPGTGAFSSPSNYDTGKGPQAMAVADINADSIPDLVVAHSKGIDIFRGGGGTFQLVETIPTGGKKPVSVLFGQFDADVDLDIAVAHAGSGTVAILLNNGNLTFTEPQLVKVAKSLTTMKAVQLDAGGTVDLVVAAKSGKLGVLLGNGDGTFQTPQLIATGGKGSRDLAIADFNGDGPLDIAVANQTSNNVGLLLGNGDGTFAEVQQIAVGIKPSALTTGDFDGDGAVDLVVAHAVSRFVSVLLGNGAASGVPPFDAPIRISYPSGKSAAALLTTDLDFDGRADLLVLNRAAGSLSALIGLGNGTFAFPVEFDLGNVPVSAVIADFNNDGLLDIATANQKTNDVSVLLRVS